MQVYFILIAFGLWLLGISFVLYRIYNLFSKLTKGVGEEDLKKILEKILSQQDLSKKELDEIKNRIGFLENDGRLHVQKVGLIRFNPFKELGGDHSFCLAILNGEDSGVVITGLHTRDRTRVYMKEIKRGKAEHELSIEEKKALESAYNNRNK